MTEQETKILTELQKGLPVGPRPFCALAEKADCTEKEAFSIVQSFMHDGTIRKFGGFINHSFDFAQFHVQDIVDSPDFLG